MSGHFAGGLRAWLPAVVLTALVAGCTEERVPTSLPGAHPPAWIDPASADFHGDFVLARNADGCKVCHGNDYNGGKVNVSCIDCHLQSGTACTACHGGVDNQTGAPPRGLRGEVADSALAVGAHTVHLEGGGLTDGIDCAACHNVPVFSLDPAHLGSPTDSTTVDSMAEVIWHGFADAGGATWDRAARTCSDTYCHGKFAGGDSANTPVWTAANQAVCGSCHDVGGDPATLGWKHQFHVAFGGLDCVECHAAVVDSQLNIRGLDLHVNGVADTLIRDRTLCNTCHGAGGTACTLCHGGIDNQTGAPPKGLEGETATTDLAVGAHTLHLSDGRLADAFACDACHIYPDSLLAAGHLEADSVAEIVWGDIAPAPGVTWDRPAAACENTYCHGNFPGGNVDNRPVWTNVRPGLCGPCHDAGGNPSLLGSYHDYHVRVAGLLCDECHFAVTDTLFHIRDITLHINGVADVSVRDSSTCEVCHGDPPKGCVYCHGGVDNGTGAPPKGLHGETQTTQLAVGAHSAHVQDGALADAFDCTECHVKPANLLTMGHLGLDSTAEVNWGGIAPAPGASWTRGSATCQDTYCHGNFAGGDGGNAPVWTAANQATCGSCHDVGSDPNLLGGRHEKHVAEVGLACQRCHAATTDPVLAIVGADVHVNGQREVVFSTGQGVFLNNTCSGLGGGCHGSENWY